MEPDGKASPAAPQPSGPRLVERFVKVLRALGAFFVRVAGRLSWTPPPWSVAAAARSASRPSSAPTAAWRSPLRR
jgi:hypothetical protein